MLNDSPNWLKYCVNTAIFLAFIVVMLGAYTRLTHAGLGCPDWPLCYGKLVVSQSIAEPQHLQAYPNSPFSSSKAWTEMSHRYLAGTLALLVFFTAAVLIKRRQQQLLAVSLIFMLLFQAALGMWTVTLKLLPIVVMAHLLGGILIFSLLACLRLRLAIAPGGTIVKLHDSQVPWLLPALALGLFLLVIQIALGGWVSANYAGIACLGFPTCNGLWMPEWHFKEGFHLFSAVGTNYQGGVLDSASRITIQMAHRMGALVIGSYLLVLSIAIIKRQLTWSLQKRLATLLLVLVLLQWTLGIINVVYWLPLGVAVAHNGVAALLMACLSLLFVNQKQWVPHGAV